MLSIVLTGELGLKPFEVRISDGLYFDLVSFNLSNLIKESLAPVSIKNLKEIF